MDKTYFMYTAEKPTFSTPHPPNDQPEGYGLLILAIIFVLFYFLLIRPHLIIWRRLPTLEQYLQRNPHCKTDRGVKCNVCGSRSVRSFGQKHAADRRRIGICNSCSAKLYKSS